MCACIFAYSVEMRFLACMFAYMVCGVFAVDPCTQERDQGFGSAQLQRYTFNKHTKMCEPFIYFGSAGNRNNFHSLHDCQQQCPGVD